jgi:predicted secreted hydrolase
LKRRRFLASPLLLVATGVVEAEDYPRVVPGYRLQFPRDFGAHPAFRTEWWYITGWVHDAAGNDIGVQVTFFRNRPRIAEANTSQFAPRQFLFAHAAIADPRGGRLRHDQRAARAGFGLAEAAEATTDVRIGDWSLKLDDGKYVARIEAQDFRFNLIFAPTQPVLLEGAEGFSRKGQGIANASYYYSQPQLAVTGSLAFDGRAAEVTGTAWLDHEWSSEAMAAGMRGWDWIGINLHDGGALMAFRMRDDAGNALWAGGALRTTNGTSTRFEPNDVAFAAQRRWRSPRTGVEYPVEMQVRAGGIDYTLVPLMDDQELDSRANTGTIYWEGAVRMLQGSREVGRGYLELTGYWKALKL